MAEIKVRIWNEIQQNDVRITDAINKIQTAAYGDRVIIYFNNNAGGSIKDAVNLIGAIESSSSTVKIVLVFKNYAVSAAAFIMCYFSFYNVVTTNVTVQIDKRVCMVYHKPRAINRLNTFFATDLYPDRTYPNAIEFVRQITPLFDVVFNAMFKACYAKNIRIAPQMKAVYNVNGDVSVIFRGN